MKQPIYEAPSVYADYKSFTFGDAPVVFPMAGYKDEAVTTSYAGTRAGVWSASYRNDNKAYFLNIRPTTTYVREYTGKSRGYSVRCVKE